MEDKVFHVQGLENWVKGIRKPRSCFKVEALKNCAKDIWKLRSFLSFRVQIIGEKHMKATILSEVYRVSRLGQQKYESYDFLQGLGFAKRHMEVTMFFKVKGIYLYGSYGPFVQINRVYKELGQRHIEVIIFFPCRYSYTQVSSIVHVFVLCLYI